MSRGVETSGSCPAPGGRPCTEWKTVFDMPSAAAFSFISSVNPSFVPATWIASATAASLPDCTISAYSSSSIVKISPSFR